MSSLHPLVLFAAEPTWTDKEVFELTIKVVVGMVTLVGVAFPIATSWFRRRAKLAQKEREKVQREYERLRNEHNRLASEKDRLSSNLALTQLQMGQVSENLRKMVEQASELEVDVAIKNMELDEHQSNLNNLHDEHRQHIQKLK